MKITAFFILVVCLQVSASGISQTVSFNGTGASLEQVFAAVEKQTDYVIYYTSKQIRESKPVTINATNWELPKLLEKVLTDQGLSYSIKEKTIFIQRIKVEGGVVSPWLELASPPIDVRGRITTTEGEPVAGASVMVKGSKEGTTTDVDGNFVLNNVDENDVLVITGTNIERLEWKIEGRGDVSVMVKKMVNPLDEVVFKGYYAENKRFSTSNVSKITSSTIEKQPVSNPIATLQGRVSGVEIMQETGVPGGNFAVRIRGQNSISNGNDPLYIIDGVPFISATMAFNETSQSILFNGTSPLIGINPADIESIEILKDADATAIFGSRGANGVILINTKKGKDGKTKMDFRYLIGAGKVSSKMEMLNTSQYLLMRKEAFQNDGRWPFDESMQQYVPDLFAWDSTRTTDWQEELMGETASITDAQLTLSGGDRFSQFLVGVGYHKEGTVFPGKNFDRRISTLINVNNASANQKFKSSISLKYSINESDLLNRDLTSLALTLPPNAPPVYNEIGELNWGTSLGSNTWVHPYLSHPLSYLKTGYEANTKNLLFNALATYAIFPNLDIKSSFGYSDVAMSAVTTTPKSSYSPTVAAFELNQSAFSSSKFANWTAEPQINWRPKLGDGRFDILVGTTFLQQVQDGSAQIALGFTSENLMKNIGAASIRIPTTNYYSKYRYLAGFGRINFTLDGKYIINVTGRRDGSSRFGQSKQFASFGAVGLAWIFSDEAFIQKNFPFISFGKLRGSFGITGNDQLTNYQYLDSYTSSGTYLGVVGLTPVRLANSQFAWETNRKIEVGFEFGAIKNKIQGGISYYQNRSSNQLVGYPLPPTTGFTSIQGNLPAIVENSGFEIELKSVNVERSIKWSTSINISIPNTKLVDFPRLESSAAYANSLVIGEPLSIIKRYNYLGVDVHTGLYQFEDVNGDGAINVTDKTSVKFIGQDLYGGLLNNFEYKGFQLDILFHFVKQTKLNYLSVFGTAPGSGFSNEPSWVLDRWSHTHRDGELQLYTNTAQGISTYSLFRESTQSVVDASFVRLKNLSISYSFSSSLIKQLHIQNARIFLLGQNLATITDYRGLDPEPSSSFSLPPLKVISVGLNLTF